MNRYLRIPDEPSFLINLKKPSLYFLGRQPVNGHGPHQRQRLPEPNRSQCVSLLSRMMLAAVNANNQPQNTKQP